MNHFRQIRQTVSLILLLALVSVGMSAQGQIRRNGARLSYAQLGDIISRVETASNQFHTNLNTELNNGTVGVRRQQNITTYLNDYESALQQLRARYNRRTARATDVQFVLDRATLVNNFINRNRQSNYLANDWAAVSTQLSELARAYNLNWRGTVAATTYPSNNPTYNPNNPTYNQPYGADAMLTGTFRLERTQGDDPRVQAERATSRLPYRDRQRVTDALMMRLEAPDALAIERRGRTVTIASSRAPQITFEADGVARTERLADGRSVRAVAAIYGDQLSVSTSGDRNSDFTVTFDPSNNGRSLVVTRRVSDINLTQPVTVRSFYTRTADVAQFDIYNGAQSYPTTGGYGTGTGTGTANDTFIIPNNTTLVAMLNNDLTTANAHEGDRFTLTVRDPAQYDGATIEGTVGRVSRSGRITGRSELALNLDTIRLRDGSSYRFAGIIETVRSANGETVRVDNEGTVQDNDSRGQTTAQRAAIGTAVGAIIGAIAGGGKGAAIGAILGAGGGAGSVYVQGADDLELRNGTEVTIRTTGPNNR
ncbi:MAG TPA: hypothetical protein VF525_08470 [Pyrinomonadaceae bacterium]|jgi:hypothetical protein